MKKLFLTAVMAIVMATPVHAACEGGTLSDDGQFCISDITLNWWSASNWCKANGRRLATMYEVCPDWDGNDDAVCPVISRSIGSKYLWTATVLENNKAFNVRASDGLVNYYERTFSERALCK